MATLIYFGDVLEHSHYRVQPINTSCAYDSKMASHSMLALTNAGCLLYFIQDEPKEAAHVQSMWPLTPRGVGSVYTRVNGSTVLHWWLMLSTFDVAIITEKRTVVK